MLLLFGLSAVSIVLALTYSVEVGEAGQSKGGAAKIEQDFARYGSLATKLAARTEWKAPAEGHRLFIARKLEWRPEEKKLKLYNPFDPGPDGLTPAWKEQYGFDLADPKVGDQDTDADGFTNREEFQAQTDPTDKVSHPPFITKLRLKEFRPVPFAATFKSYTESGGQIFFSILTEPIKIKYPNSAALGFSKGDALGDWVICDFKPNKGQKMSVKTKAMADFDESELEVQNTKTGKKESLVLKTKKDLSEASGSLVNLIGNQVLPISVVKPFSFDGVEYKVEELTDKAAVLVKPNGEKITLVP